MLEKVRLARRRERLHQLLVVCKNQRHPQRRNKNSIFVCKGGAEAGVYGSLQEVLAAVKKSGGTFEAFDS